MKNLQDLIEQYFPDFVEKHKLLFAMISTAVVSVGVTYWLLNQFQISPLKDEKISLQQELLPFKTAALTKFPSSSQEEALSTLATRIGQLELNVISIFDYKEVASWSFFGSYV